MSMRVQLCALIQMSDMKKHSLIYVYHSYYIPFQINVMK